MISYLFNRSKVVGLSLVVVTSPKSRENVLLISMVFLSSRMLVMCRVSLALVNCAMKWQMKFASPRKTIELWMNMERIFRH